jgi:hypothetical protein
MTWWPGGGCWNTWTWLPMKFFAPYLSCMFNTFFWIHIYLFFKMTMNTHHGVIHQMYQINHDEELFHLESKVSNMVASEHVISSSDEIIY